MSIGDLEEVVPVSSSLSSKPVNSYSADEVRNWSIFIYNLKAFEFYVKIFVAYSFVHCG